MLCHIKSGPAKGTNPYPTSYLCSCLAKCKDGSEIICIGDSLGNVHCFYQVKNVYLKETLYTISEMPIITALAGDEKNCMIGVGTSEGKIFLLSAAKPNEANIVSIIPSFGLKFPVTTMGVLQSGTSLLLAGYSNGQVKGYRLPEGKQALTINAHARSITAMAVHPTKSVIATVGEDCIMSLFEIAVNPATKDYDASLIMSSKVENTLLTGVAFLPMNYSSVIAVGYDESKIFYWKDAI